MADAVTTALLSAAIVLSLAMTIAWAVQRWTGNSGWIDTIWTFAAGASAVCALVIGPGDASRRILLGVLVAAWSLRLGMHILARTRSTDDDPRYARLMTEWGEAAPFCLFVFLQIQAVAAFVLVLAVVLAATSDASLLSPLTLLFAALAAASIVGEGVADAQLAACKRHRPANGICDKGLWGLSRHPNYFFEWLFWASIAAMALVPPMRALGFFALLAPAMMYYLLRYASGVPHLEAHLERTRPEAFADYKRRVPVFFPKLW